MRAAICFSALLISLATGAVPAIGQGSPPPAERAPPAAAPAETRFSSSELLNSGHRFFGGVSRGLAQVIEKAVSQWGLPNGYVLGEEAAGAFVIGLRYGEGMLYTKNAGDLKVFWQGPSVGFDTGGEGARTMMLVYNLPATQAIYERFVRIGLSCRRLRHDRAHLQQCRPGADPGRRGPPARRQHRLPEVHPEGDLEPALSGASEFRLTTGKSGCSRPAVAW
jgi:hypothetical protein